MCKYQNTQHDRIVDILIDTLNAEVVTFDDLLTVRSLVECYVVEQLALYGVKEQFAQLKDLLERTEQAFIRNEDIRSNYIGFHCLVFRLCSSSILAAIGESLIYLVAERLRVAGSRKLSLAHLSMHKELLAAIEARDAGLAKTLLNYEINTLRDIQAGIDKSQEPPSKMYRAEIRRNSTKR